MEPVMRTSSFFKATILATGAMLAACAWAESPQNGRVVVLPAPIGTYQYGSVINKDVSESLKWLRKADEQGNFVVQENWVSLDANSVGNAQRLAPTGNSAPAGNRTRFRWAQFLADSLLYTAVGAACANSESKCAIPF